ncbi:MAG: Flp pilus assembly complex ATPase component TadA, partial [Candidatus Omnitrophica bacterium]|nr:Flp pilus assembly complex ATPase component TadA [Candidatus Omnitrophota bacterium]
MAETLKDKILKTLIDNQKISQQEIDEAISLQKKKGVSLDKVLIEKGLINENDLLMMLVRELNIPFINLTKYKINQELKDVVPEKTARQYGIIPLSCLDQSLTVALADPLNIFIIDDLKNITGKEIDIVMSTESEILKAIDVFYGSDSIASVNEISKDIQLEDMEIVQDDDNEANMDGAVDESEKAPIIRMVNLVIKEAIKSKASDIHIEPMIDQVRVRYRIDGVLSDILDIPKENQNAVITRIKILSRLDITANQVPQDGRFKLKLSNKEVDFRVSLLPTIFGQKVVMRILDKSNLSIGLNGLGISEKTLALFNESIRKPFGMILVTGPTGSGKSTTLYSIVNELNTIEKNVITVEDPVEFLIDGLTQIQARPEIGLTFAEGLRSILRQSPDIVMVGEIRDNETADIAIKASLTGQLVLSTLHTNDAAGALTRLVDMKVEPFLVASSLVLVSAQRLCRKICSKCKEETKVPADVLDQINYQFKPDVVFYKGKGCDACKKTGYAGRLSVTEVLEVDDEIRKMLISGASSNEIKKYA